MINAFNDLRKNINIINDIIRINRIEKENEHHYLKYIIEQVNTGIISIIESGVNFW